MKAVNIISREHRSLTAILYTLKRLAEESGDSGKDVPFKVFHGILYYIDSFLDRYHHPKENSHLFPLVMQRAPESAELVTRLGKEHGKGEALMDELLRALSAYEFLGQSGLERFRQAVERYVEFERQHVEAEEKELIPIAMRSLTEADWEQIDDAFLDHEDPMFGDVRSREFDALYNELVGMIPAPYGLG